jgi:hypothetical protein
VLIVCILVVLGCADVGRETGNWWPLVISIAGTPVFMWLYRRGFLT